MKEIERLRLKAIRLATELESTLSQLESRCPEEADRTVQEKIAYLKVTSEDLRSDLINSLVILK